MKVTLGGQRLGSGNKREQELHNYYRSTFNLDESFRSSLAPGVLYPCYVNTGTNGDVFEISMDALARTIPTRGPLFGTYKLQIDVFSIPVRLYQGVLHNNPINIGLQMKDIYLPGIRLFGKDGADDLYTFADKYTSQISSNSLMKYLGVSGVGRRSTTTTNYNVNRIFNAIPVLAYYDIFKNYYANKQEDLAYVITQDNQFVNPLGSFFQAGNDDSNITIFESNQVEANNSDTKTKKLFLEIESNANEAKWSILYGTSYSNPAELVIKIDDLGGYKTLEQLKKLNILKSYTINETGKNISSDFIYYTVDLVFKVTKGQVTEYSAALIKSSNIDLVPFELANIDLMREHLLTQSELGAQLVLGDNGFGDYYPYSTLTEADQNGYPRNVHPMNGLCVKTYQSDLFNNWLKTEWIDGENGINAITAVSTTGGSFTIDSLNLANKVYNMLNRVAISGGTYQDWQEAIYTQKAVRHAETPMYEGGMSTEIVFDEVISTASGQYENENQSLGTLGGRGKQMGKKGGKMRIELKEPSFIMAIVSITPRVTYSQGNMWYMTELQSVDDYHKPALDGIGFQDLICEQMGWWDAAISNRLEDNVERTSAGKVPAWINYMTSFDKCYGDFANAEGKSFMTLNRNYSMDFVNNQIQGIKDVTTYIDPSKFNYVFAYSEIDAQNFWLQIDFNVKARRVMSAKQIPNL